MAIPQRVLAFRVLVIVNSFDVSVNRFERATMKTEHEGRTLATAQLCIGRID